MDRDLKSLRDSFNKTAEIYDKETETFHHKITEYITIENLLLELPQNKEIKILDSGGGTGKYTILLKKLGYQVTLIDISSISINEAKKKADKNNVSIDAYVSNSEETIFPDNNFDFIMMNGGVISYTPNPDKLLKEVHRILKPKGLVYFDFLNTVGWAIETLDSSVKVALAAEKDRLIRMPDWDYAARVMSIENVRDLLNNNKLQVKSEYGLVLLSNSLPLEQRYSKEYDLDLLEKYKKIELELSRNPECIGASWSRSICAIKE